MNHDYFVISNYKISKPNKFQHVDIIKDDKKYKISMDCYDIYDLLKKEHLEINEISKLKNFLFYNNCNNVQVKYNNTIKHKCM